MRYRRAGQILRLCTMFAARHQGVGLQDIMDHFEVSRSTAERMRDAAMDLMEEVEEFRDDSGRKRWRGKGAVALGFGITAAELATLNAAARLMKQENRLEEAETLSAISDKILAAQPQNARRRIEPDLELLLESEGLALRPGPKVVTRAECIETLRMGMLMSQRVELIYSGRLDPTPRKRVLEPYGFLYGQRPFLVARRKDGDTLLHYRLQGITEARLLEESFVRDEGFTLEDHARQCFGTFREEPFDVVWRFRPEAAKDAVEYVFHPDQKTEFDDEGALIVRFRAGGALEMAWHLMTWGDSVEVVEPTDFWERARVSRARFA